MSGTVWIVVEGPDMTYYGDAQIHGVYSTAEGAQARARQIWPDWKPDDCQWRNRCVGEYEVDRD